MKWESSAPPSTPTAPCRASLALAGQAGTVEGEAVEGAEDGDGDLISSEILAGGGLEVFAGGGFDAGENFVERVKTPEVQVPGRGIGPPRAGGFEGEHPRGLHVIFRAAKFF